MAAAVVEEARARGEDRPHRRLVRRVGDKHHGGADGRHDPESPGDQRFAADECEALVRAIAPCRSTGQESGVKHYEKDARAARHADAVPGVGPQPIPQAGTARIDTVGPRALPCGV
jgi:hypothetical protein